MSSTSRPIRREWVTEWQTALEVRMAYIGVVQQPQAIFTQNLSDCIAAAAVDEEGKTHLAHANGGDPRASGFWGNQHRNAEQEFKGGDTPLMLALGTNYALEDASGNSRAMGIHMGVKPWKDIIERYKWPRGYS